MKSFENYCYISWGSITGVSRRIFISYFSVKTYGLGTTEIATPNLFYGCNMEKSEKVSETPVEKEPCPDILCMYNIEKT